MGLGARGHCVPEASGQPHDVMTTGLCAEGDGTTQNLPGPKAPASIGESSQNLHGDDDRHADHQSKGSQACNGESFAHRPPPYAAPLEP